MAFSKDSKSVNLLVCCTGSVASMKIPILLETFIKSFKEAGISYQIRLIATDFAKHFFNFNDVPNSVNFYQNEDEWSSWSKRGDPVLHIDLSKWADICVIAPMDANTLAKISQGLCDNLLTCVARAWDQSKPFYFCPAMNTKMWNHPITGQQIKTLSSWGYKEIPCIYKTLVCGDTGFGAMAEIETIVEKVIQENIS